MGRGIAEIAEHGPGVGGSIGRLARVRPLLRFEAETVFVIARLAKQAVAISPPGLRRFPRRLRLLGMTEIF